MWHCLTNMPKKMSPVATPLAQYSSHLGNTTPVSGRVAGNINRQDVELTETKKPDNHSNIRLHCTRVDRAAGNCMFSTVLNQVFGQRK